MLTWHVQHFPVLKGVHQFPGWESVPFFEIPKGLQMLEHCVALKILLVLVLSGVGN